MNQSTSSAASRSSSRPPSCARTCWRARASAATTNARWPGATLAACGALLAIPQTRAAILRVLEIGGVRIERTETQPQALRGALATGSPVTLADARRAVQFPLAVPESYDRVYLTRSVPGAMVSFVWDGHVLSEWQGEQIYQKSVGPGTQIEHVQVDFAPGVWMTGAPR